VPLTRYFNKPGGKPSEGPAVMAKMQARYGAKAGERVFYATVNKMRKGTPAQRAAQPASAPGSALMNARRRRRAGRTKTRGNLSGPPQATGAAINGASTSTTRIGY
jgi:hypothetical protein